MYKEFLRRLPLFAELSEEDLEQLHEVAVAKEIGAGQVLVEEGSEPDSLFVILDGEFEVTQKKGKEDIVLSVRKSGEIVGEMSLLGGTPRNATLTAIGNAKVLVISQKAFFRVLACSPSAVQAMLHTFVARLRSTETLAVQNEKMAALGRLSAGLAHELNNPAAAVSRSTDQLKERLAEWQRWDARLDAMTFGAEQTGQLEALREQMVQRADGCPILDPIDRSDREDTMQSWLEDHDIEDAWEFSPMLVSFGWEPKELDEIGTHFSPEELKSVIPWLASGCSTYAMLEEVGKGAKQISEIVRGMKGYSYLDQAPVQQVDIHKGIEDTLIILRHKIKHGVTVKRDFAKDLPKIEAYASELNQVWTNIIDNAVDAMDGRGQITIKTYGKDENVVVEITDNGPGIPADVLPQIFQPFFTTKPQGQGTGLGLHITYNIIADKHRGRISATSEPGKTMFQVVLPVKLARGQSTP
jgi:signal transduction histidine kinase